MDDRLRARLTTGARRLYDSEYVRYGAFAVVLRHQREITEHMAQHFGIATRPEEATLEMACQSIDMVFADQFTRNKPVYRSYDGILVFETAEAADAFQAELGERSFRYDLWEMMRGFGWPMQNKSQISS